MTDRVVYFTDSAAFGGAEQVMLTLLAGLDRQMWKPILMYHPEPGIALLADRARRLGVSLHEVPRMAEGREGVTRLPAFIRELRRVKPSVFHAHLTSPTACKYGLLGAGLARVPAVVATEHLFLHLPWTRSHRIKHRVVAAGVHRYIAVSYDLARHLREAFSIPQSKLQVIHNGIPVDNYLRPPRADLRDWLAGSPPGPIVLTTGRLDAQKGHRFLLEAAAQIPHARFVLAGDGPERGNLEAQARELELGDRVRFLGYRDDIPDLLASCDIFVLPSLFEGLPLSVLEAMAAGRPVVSSAIGGTDEAVVQEETGLLVPPGDAGALARALLRVLSDASLATKWGDAGRSRVREHFSAATMVEGVTGVYSELLGAVR